MSILEILFLALSLSVDSLVVSMCGSVSLGKARLSGVVKVAFAFAFMQTTLFFIGWAFGAAVLSYVEKFAKIIGFLLLAYVGVNMMLPVILRKAEEKVDLAGIRNLLIAAVATSIDATAAGVSYAMAGCTTAEIVIMLSAIFAITALASATGVVGGSRIGRRFGPSAHIVGGIVLIGLGVSLLF